MPYMEITTNIGCKNACVYCPQNTFIKAYTRRSNISLMSFHTFKTCVDKMPNSVGIIFAGFCEPWSNPNCSRMLLYSYEKGHNVTAFTTLQGLHLKDIDLLESIPFDSFQIHLPSDGRYEKFLIDENYLNVLNRMLQSKIKINFHVNGKQINSKVSFLKKIIKEKIEKIPMFRRAGNVKIRNKHDLFRKRGVIACTRNLRHNILLPNGDVVLCCMDYGLKHIMGNLLSSDYNSLFNCEEFLKVKTGLKEESLDILCRNCDWLSYDVNFKALVYNFPYRLDDIFCRLRNIRNFEDLSQFMKKINKVLKGI